MTKKQTEQVDATEQDFRRALERLKGLNFAKYSPALVALIGSQEMLKQLLEQVKKALNEDGIDSKLQARLQKLREQFIPQLAELNNLKDLETKPTKTELKDFFKNAKQAKMQLGENKVFLRIIHHALGNFLETKNITA